MAIGELVDSPTNPHDVGLSAKRLDRIREGLTERIAAYRVLSWAAKQIGRGDSRSLIAEATGKLLTSGFDAVDYVDIRDGELRAVGPGCDPGSLRAFGAARLGSTRLIDNVSAGGEWRRS